MLSSQSGPTLARGRTAAAPLLVNLCAPDPPATHAAGPPARRPAARRGWRAAAAAAGRGGGGGGAGCPPRAAGGGGGGRPPPPPPRPACPLPRPDRRGDGQPRQLPAKRSVKLKLMPLLPNNRL